VGYWCKPDLTTAAFKSIPNNSQRIYRTGDLGRFLPDGRLLHLGRKDSQVKIRGQRIEVGEIEATLMSHPQVQELAVVARDNEMEDKYLVAYIVPQPEVVPNINDLRNFLFKQLPEAMVPSTFVFMEALPLLPNGKINRLALPEVDQMRPALQSNFIAPRDALEEHLAELWEIVLSTQPIGVRDNFFDLGGHSLASSQLLSQIKKLYERELPLSALFQAPTIEQLADLLRQEGDTPQWNSLIPLQPQGSKPPFFCLPGNLGNVFTDLHYLPRYMSQDQPIYGLQDGVEAPSNVEALAVHYLQEVKSKQPQGPYFLGGICAGGVVAFEMARQLQSQGETISLLALIEPAPPRGPSLRSYVGFARTVLRRVTRRLGHHSSTLTRLESAEQKDFTRLKAKLIANSWALRQYAPQVYNGKIHLFLAEETIKTAKNPRFNWGKFAAAGTAIHQIPGNHDSVTGDNDTDIDEQGMQVLAGQLQTCIDEALGNNNSSSTRKKPSFSLLKSISG
jgi:thioesterase domain-containing protein/acyl carrier protein